MSTVVDPMNLTHRTVHRFSLGTPAVTANANNKIGMLVCLALLSRHAKCDWSEMSANLIDSSLYL